MLTDEQRNKILAMQPGRELDALIAEKVMGWDVEIYAKQNGWWVRERETDAYQPFHPSTDISAAWEVVKKMKPKWTFRITSHLKSVEVEYWWEYYAGAVRAKSAPEAICKAALLVVMDE